MDSDRDREQKRERGPQKGPQSVGGGGGGVQLVQAANTLVSTHTHTNTPHTQHTRRPINSSDMQSVKR